MPVYRCYVKLIKPTTPAVDHESATREIREILGETYGPDFLFDYDTWVREMYIKYEVSESLDPESGWDNATKSVGIVLESPNDLTEFADVFFKHEFSVKAKNAYESYGWGITEPYLSVE